MNDKSIGSFLKKAFGIRTIILSENRRLILNIRLKVRIDNFITNCISVAILFRQNHFLLDLVFFVSLNFLLKERAIFIKSHLNMHPNIVPIFI